MHHCVKVANPAGLVPLPPIEGVRLAAGGAKHPPRGFRGIPPDTPLVTFVVKRKSPGCRAWQSHDLAERLQVGVGTAVPQKPPRAERPPSGAVGAKPPKKLPGAHPPAVEREKRGAQRGQHLWCTTSHGGEKPRAAHPLRKSRSFIKIYNLFISLLHLCYIMKRTKELSCSVWESLLELKAVRR